MKTMQSFGKLIFAFTILPCSLYSIWILNKSRFPIKHMSRDVVTSALPPNHTLLNVMSKLTVSHIHELSRYLVHGTEVSEIGPDHTFPIPLGVDNVHPRLLEYIQWHALQMKCIRTAECFESKKDSLNILIWKCYEDMQHKCNGVGDRLRGMVSALAMAVLGNHVLLLDWPQYPYRLYTAVAPAAIDWQVPDHVMKDVDDSQWGILRNKMWDTTEANMFWKKCPPKYLCTDSGSQEKSNGTDNKRIPPVMSMRHDASYNVLRVVGKLILEILSPSSMGIMRNPSWAREFPTIQNIEHYGVDPLEIMSRHLLRTLIRPSPITEFIMYSLDEQSKERVQQGYLSIHLRTGKDVGEQGNRFKNQSNLQPGEIATRVLHYVLNDTRTKRYRYIYVSSDSRDFNKELRKSASSLGLHVSYSDLPVTHIGKAAIYGGGSALRFENLWSWLGFINIFVDFFRLANGTEMIYNYSQFSLHARLLSNTPLTQKLHLDM